ncbi:ParB/RepB/Spo0J family partition protein [Thermospira aquatica]|uniref:ParB N-terminal domain-containing protein n=1 Tax=Thermospira aquatica TaxID=2828656 RepID=A0AAX3BEE7_9SPIR|nr:ParB/RepB/Spo0J family partition protein [Thermospira aquatica]URA10610.1 ParB N-terminal domain-containing protein [Thermospira aquatica]
MAYEQSTKTLGLLNQRFGLSVGGSKYEAPAILGEIFASTGLAFGLGIDGRSEWVIDEATVAYNPGVVETIKDWKEYMGYFNTVVSLDPQSVKKRLEANGVSLTDEEAEEIANAFNNRAFFESKTGEKKDLGEFLGGELKELGRMYENLTEKDSERASVAAMMAVVAPVLGEGLALGWSTIATYLPSELAAGVEVGTTVGGTVISAYLAGISAQKAISTIREGEWTSEKIYDTIWYTGETFFFTTLSVVGIANFATTISGGCEPSKIFDEEIVPTPVNVGFFEKLFKRKANISEITPNLQDPFRYPENVNSEALSRYRDYIRMHGGLDFANPIFVRKLPSGKYEILDGHHRWWAARQMGLKKVPIKIIK